ncbi:MAG: rod shape-determining protein RodA [Candidatus Omnitrophica bacterium]|nr:rod shape-determining protein RodA [Candidatus Omnitrophota bacterium]
MGRSKERILGMSVSLIIVFGLIALFSASYQNIRVAQNIFYDQLFFAGLGIGLLLFLRRFDYRRFTDAAYIFYGVNVALLLAVLLIGRHALGARRWFEVAGVSFQPSELMKLSLIFLLARYWSGLRERFAYGARNPVQAFWRDLLFPFFLTAVPMFFVFKQPDLGTSLLMFGIFFIMAYAAGVQKRHLSGFLGFCLAMIPVAWKFLKSYQKDRLLVFLNPNIDPLGAGYTIIQSKIAIGSGQIFGKGWLSGTQNQLNFLPERHTDFIFSVIGEEWGLLGTWGLATLYFILIWNLFRLAEQTDAPLPRLLITGIASIWALQVIINIGMVMGLFPIVGITLPLVSYGRTSFLMYLMTIGIVLNICRKQTY